MMNETKPLEQVITDALTAAINAVGKASGCKPVVWRVDKAAHGDNVVHIVGQVPGGDYAEDEAVQIAEQWAGALGLTKHPFSMPGTVDYSGHVDAVYVTLWVVSDRDVFEAHFNQRTAR